LRSGRPTPRAERSSTSLVHLLGWRVYHTWDSRKSEPDFPDLVLVRDRVMFAELKSPRGRLRKDQAAWLCALRAAGAEAVPVVAAWTENALGEIGAWNP
jgi:hypothetical protein